VLCPKQSSLTGGAFLSIICEYYIALCPDSLLQRKQNRKYVTVAISNRICFQILLLSSESTSFHSQVSLIAYYCFFGPLICTLESLLIFQASFGTHYFGSSAWNCLTQSLCLEILALSPSQFWRCFILCSKLKTHLFSSICGF